MTDEQYSELVSPPDSFSDVIEMFIIDQKLDLTPVKINETKSDDTSNTAQKRISKFYFYKDFGNSRITNTSISSNTGDIIIDNTFDFNFFRLWICVDDCNESDDINIDMYRTVNNSGTSSYNNIDENSYVKIFRRVENKTIINIFRNDRTVMLENNKISKITIRCGNASKVCGVIY